MGGIETKRERERERTDWAQEKIITRKKVVKNSAGRKKIKIKTVLILSVLLVVVKSSKKYERKMEEIDKGKNNVWKIWSKW